MTSLYRMFWVRWETNFGSLWQPIKPKYGNYRGRGYNSRFRRVLKINNAKKLNHE